MSPGRGDCFWWASRGEKGLIGGGGGPVPCPHPRVGLLQACICLFLPPCPAEQLLEVFSVDQWLYALCLLPPWQKGLGAG